MYFKSIFSTVLALCIATLLSGQILKPVKWNSEIRIVGENEFEVVFHAKIKEGWSTYSQHSSDDGPIPTTVNFDEGSHYVLVGSTREEGKKKEAPEPLFDNVVVAKYSDKVDFIQRIKVSDYATPVTGYVNFMACNDRTCTPPTDFEFELTFPKPETSAKKEEEARKKEQEAIPSKGEAQKKEQAKSKTENSPQISAKEVKSDPDPEVVVKETDSKEETEEDSRGSKILDPVKWSYSINKTGEEYEIIYTADIIDGWHTYSQFVAEDGPIPTSFNLDEGQHFSKLGQAEEVSDHRVEGYDKYFDMDVVKFKKKVDFVQKIKVADHSKPVTGYLEFMACDATRCLPPMTRDFSFDIKNLIGIEVDPEATSNAGDSDGATEIKANVVNGVIDQVIPSIRETYVSPLGDCGEEDVTKGQSYLWTFILGFLGGLVALLTPCVFPMIPLTVSFFTKDTKRKGWVNALIYGASIIVIYVAIGLLITGVFGATALNELSTNWIANTIFFLIFVAFAFSFFGYYEIQLPSSWANKSDAMADKGGLIGIFFMAFTLALVSFSCTGPIIGSAIVQSATSSLGPFIVMLGFSIALAIPFGLFAAFPAFLNSLPRSGSWMNSVKVVLGFLELALALKFLSVADMTKHWGILKYELFMGLWVLLFGAMALYLFGFIKFPHDSPIKKLSPTRWVFALGSLALTIYLATGFFFNEKTQAYDSLSLMSGLAPPAHYNYFLTAPEVDPEIKKKYPSYTKCANNLNCFKDYYEGMAFAKEMNKPVLLDFTGHGCVNCRKTEEHIWIKDKVWNKLSEDLVLISLYVDDRKEVDEILKSKSTNARIRNVGNKWADFQIVNFEQNSQPLYVLMTPDQKVMAKPRGFKEGVDDYADFLDCGLEVFKKL